MFYVAIIVILVGSFLLIAGFKFLLETILFLKMARRANGTVVRHTTQSSMYHSVVTFQTQQNQTYTVTSKASSSSPLHKIGQQVTILYLPKRPADAKIQSFWEQWLIPLVFFVLGGALFIYGVSMFDFKVLQ